MKKNASKFKKEVEKRLIDMDMSKRDLSNEMGISLAFLCDLLNGNRRTEERIKQIRRILNIDKKDKPVSIERSSPLGKKEKKHTTV